MMSTANTDGANTIRSSSISFNNWTVYNGDDSVAFKGNSTDISVRDSNFYNGLGIAIGSVGQYDGEYEVIQGVTVNNVTFHATTHAVSGFLLPTTIKGSDDTDSHFNIYSSSTSKRGRAIKSAIPRMEEAGDWVVSLLNLVIDLLLYLINTNTTLLITWRPG